jgi:hypothetical protein
MTEPTIPAPLTRHTGVRLVPVGLRLPETTAELLRSAAAAANESQSVLVDRLLRDAFAGDA